MEARSPNRGGNRFAGMVPESGLEPEPSCKERCLRPSRLPIPPLRPRGRPIVPPSARGPVESRRNPRYWSGVSPGTDARLAAPHDRHPEGPPDHGGPSLDDGPRRPRSAPRSHPHRASPRGRPRRVQRSGPAVPGPAVRAGRAHGARSRPGVGRRPGGVLLGLSEPEGLSRRQRQVLAEPDLRQRRHGRTAGAQASARAAVSRARR